MYELYLDSLDNLRELQESILMLEERLEALNRTISQAESRLLKSQIESASGVIEATQRLVMQIQNCETRAAEAEQDADRFGEERALCEIGSDQAIELARSEISSQAKRGLYAEQAKLHKDNLSKLIDKQHRLEIEIQLQKENLSHHRLDHQDLLVQLEELGNKSTEAYKTMRLLFRDLDLIRVSADFISNALDLGEFKPQITSWLENELPSLGTDAAETLRSLKKIKEAMVRKNAPTQQMLFDLGVEYEPLLELLSRKLGPKYTRDVVRHLVSALPVRAIRKISLELK